MNNEVEVLYMTVNSLRTVYVIIALYCVIMIGIPVLFGLGGLIHAIRDSIKRRRMPPVILIILAVIGAAVLMFDLYCTVRYLGSGKTIVLLLGKYIWPQPESLLLAIGTLLCVGSIGTYVFLSFHPDEVSSDDKDGRKDRAHRSGKDDEDTKAAREANARRTVMVNRALTIAVCCVLIVAIGIVIIYKLNGLVDHDVSTYTSPDGQHTIVVDNKLQTIGNTDIYFGDVFVKISPLYARLLNEAEGRRVHMEFDPDGILWYEDSVLIPYGNTYVTYYIGSIE